MYNFCFVQQWEDNGIDADDVPTSCNMAVAGELPVCLRLHLLLFSPKWQCDPLFFAHS